jgi:hypothetical protein
MIGEKNSPYITIITFTMRILTVQSTLTILKYSLRTVNV